MFCGIINAETRKIIKCALKAHKKMQSPSEDPDDTEDDEDLEVKDWPDTTFILNGDDPGMALLGTYSPWATRR
jgi:hypothetical protein